MPAQKIRPFLWFNNNGEEAINFYASVFPNAKIGNIRRQPGRGMIVGEFELEGQQFLALNGGPMYQFTEAVSLFVSCETQEEVDTFWSKLTADGGAPGRCGWLKDKFGLSWQIVPTALMRLMGDSDPVKAGRVAQAMMQMSKIEVAGLERAHRGDA